MCTLIALHRCVPGAPLVIAANRDEYLDRPACAPSLWPIGNARVVAPRDLRAGGTWLGMNASGLFVGITNRPAPARDASRRSRGLLVLEALESATASEAARRAERTPAGVYNPFNLFVADACEAEVIVYEDAPRRHRLAPGPHVIGNADPDAREVPKVSRLLEEAERACEAPPERLLEALGGICRRHGAGARPLDDTCIHAGPYGTRSSTLLRLSAAPTESLWWYADGPPCTTPYRDFTPLLRQLGTPAALPEGAQARMIH